VITSSLNAFSLLINFNFGGVASDVNATLELVNRDFDLDAIVQLEN
jgi:hypothetical protein